MKKYVEKFFEFEGIEYGDYRKVAHDTDIIDCDVVTTTDKETALKIAEELLQLGYIQKNEFWMNGGKAFIHISHKYPESFNFGYCI